MEYLYVGLGGTLGSLVRYCLGKYISGKSKSVFPIGTFIINITGALLLGAVYHLKLNNSLYLFAAEGFLGAYTTFSTFMYEGFTLFHDNRKLNAAVYILGSILLGAIGLTETNDDFSLFLYLQAPISIS
jgi:CrcB protein